jgi:hypothetical protein
MTRIDAVGNIKSLNIPRATIATLANVAAGYTSDFVNGKRVPDYAEVRIIAVVQDITAFVRFVNRLGFDPSLSDAMKLEAWISRWKHGQSREAVA